ncbi:MAG: exopolysaccharide biosynthesis polyprenyl glycosylphosphotransferase [Clostridia bacterium]|nr:exopolysaccharide biosynthesis polyprenyl glycosylphosphotransferase [Clostridia bacterium]
MIKHIIGYLQKSTYKVYGFKIIHFIATVGVFYIFFLLFRYGTFHILNRYGYRYNYYAAILYGLMILFFSRTYNSYLVGYSRIRTLVLGQFFSQALSIVLLYFIISLAWGHFINPLAFLPMMAIQLIIDVIWSYFGSILYYKLYGTKKALLIYRNQVDKRRVGSIYGNPLGRIYKIIDELQYDGSFHQLQEKLNNYDAIFVAGVNSSCRNGILKYCKENNIAGFFLPHIGDTIMQEAKHIKTFDAPVLYVNRKELDPEFAVIKRAFDIVSSGTALILLSPIILITALGIHLYDGGPAFYRQTRLTRDGKKFKILKFRSMRVDAEKDGVARLSKGENDDRITPIGRVVRRYRLDEIPQLWNILKGDMSVVGPRPERPEIAEEYYKKMPDFKLRLQVKAGLTGYAQVYGKYNTAPYEKLEFDLLYINNMSILIDLQLCFATIMTLFKKESTEGVEGVTAIDLDLDELQEVQTKNRPISNFEK